MKMYSVSFAVGLLVGVIYSVLHVRSPAPPLVALVGLLGILAGEQILPAGRHLLDIRAAAQTERPPSVRSVFSAGSSKEDTARSGENSPQSRERRS